MNSIYTNGTRVSMKEQYKGVAHMEERAMVIGVKSLIKYYADFLKNYEGNKDNLRFSVCKAQNSEVEEGRIMIFDYDLFVYEK